MLGQPNIHKKMDKILQKPATLEANDKGLAKQTSYPFVRNELPASSKSVGNKTVPCLHSTWTRISISIPKLSLG